MGDKGSEDSLGTRIASLVHAHFDALPPRSKPTVRPDGTREWIPMSGIVLVKGMFVIIKCVYRVGRSISFVSYRVRYSWVRRQA